MKYIIEEHIPLPPHPEANYFQIYITCLRSTFTLSDLRHMLDYWRPIANDAYEAASAITEETFNDFLHGLREEFQFNRYAGLAWYNRYIDIFSPSVLVVVDMVAKAYQIPWGAAYNRLLATDNINIDETGIVHYMGPRE